MKPLSADAHSKKSCIKLNTDLVHQLFFFNSWSGSKKLFSKLNSTSLEKLKTKQDKTHPYPKCGLNISVFLAATEDDKHVGANGTGIAVYLQTVTQHY